MTNKSRFDNTFSLNEWKSVVPISLSLIFLLIIFSSSFISLAAPSRELSQTNSDWEIVTMDSEGDVGEYTSLDLGKNDSVHISYNDNTNGSLKYAYLAGTTPEPAKLIFLPIVISIVE